MSDDYKQQLKNIILDPESFLRATFSGYQRGETVPWTKVTLRPVVIKDQKHIQITYFEHKKSIIKNYHGAEISESIDQLLKLPFKNYHTDSNKGNLHVQITKKGKVLVHRSKARKQQQQAKLAHDRQKNRLLAGDNAAPFLKAIGVMTRDGNIKAAMQSKYRQINEFLRMLHDIIQPETLDTKALHVVDFGCGNAYLTFAVYHYLNHIVNIPTYLIGVDVQADLLQNHVEKSQALDWANISFQDTSIIQYQPTTPADIVLALHACDTATDEAIAQGITMKSRFIFSVPCCHHHLQQQLSKKSAPSEFHSLFRDGILKEHLGDILTDTFRASILRIMGYKTDVVQFVSAEHTPKNLMIRAVKSTKPGSPELVREYEALKKFWQVTPYLEQLLSDDLAPFLAPEIAP